MPNNQTGAVSRSEFMALSHKLTIVEQTASDARQIAAETHDMVEAIHNNLLKPQPGQTKSLLDRMAAVTIDIESGKRSGQILVAIVGFLIAVGALIKWGHIIPPNQ